MRLRKENERLKRQAEYWKKQTKPTRENTVRAKDVEKFARTLLKDYESEYADSTSKHFYSKCGKIC